MVFLRDFDADDNVAKPDTHEEWWELWTIVLRVWEEHTINWIGDSLK